MRALIIILAVAVLGFTQAFAAKSDILIFADFSSTSLSAAKYKSAILNYVEKFDDNAPSSVAVEDTRGDVLLALVALQSKLTLFPNTSVIISADNEAVTQSLQGVISRNPAWSKILFVSAFASSPAVCDPAANPNTVCIMPSEFTYLSALLDASRDHLNWASVAVIMSNNEFGRAIDSLFDKVIRTLVSPSTVVSREFLPTGSSVSDEADDAVLTTSIQGRPVAVLLFVSPAEYTRVLAAKARNPAASNLFFLLSKGNVNQIKTFTGSAGASSFMKGAVFSPYYSQASNLNLMNSDTDEMGRMLLSYTFDGLLAIATSPSLRPKDIFNATYEGGYTSPDGLFSFDLTTGRRTNVQFGVNSNSYNQNPSLLSYVLRAGSSSPIWDGNTNTIKTLIPPSPLRAVTVCMAAPPECADVTNLARLLAYTLQLNAENTTVTSIVPIPINTGMDGVSGLPSFLQVSRQCSILTGPGRFSINNVFTPIINSYGITQIEYTTANPGLSDLVTYPYFNRALPSDMFNFKVLAAALDFFAWERVIVLTTADAYGNAMAKAATDAMDERAVLIEHLVQIDSITPEALIPFFKNLRDTYIGRVVLPVLPVTDAQAAMFLDTWFSMGDKTTIFLFSNIFCQYLSGHPEQRARIPSSICALPRFDQSMVDATVPSYKSLLPRVRSSLLDAGFDKLDQCDLDSWGPYSVFALDTAKMLRQIVANATKLGVVINTTNMMPMIRGVTFNGVTSPFSITSKGDRTSAEYNLDIQEKGGNITVFGYWSSINTPNFKFLLPNKNSILWLDGSYTIPAATIRSLTFIAQTTLTASPGTIVLSVLGFLGTFLVFGFCYRHYRSQRLLEIELEQIDAEYDRAQKEREVVS